MSAGKVQVNRGELAKILEASGFNPDVALKGRITVHAVVRRACTRCGLPQIETPGAGEVCSCPGGPFGAVEDRGIISDSGPRGFFARQWWKMTRALKKAPLLKGQE